MQRKVFHARPVFEFTIISLGWTVVVSFQIWFKDLFGTFATGFFFHVLLFFSLNWSHCEGCTAVLMENTEPTLGSSGNAEPLSFQPCCNTFYLFWTVYLARWYQRVRAEFTVMRRGARSLFCLPPKDSADKRAADLFISFAARDTDREDVSPVNKAQPTQPSFGQLGSLWEKWWSSSSSNFSFKVLSASYVRKTNWLEAPSIPLHSNAVIETEA